jgi:hypothetical protein
VYLFHQGLGATNFIPIPYPVPVPIAVPVPFSGSETDFLDALRLKLRPPLVPPYLHAWYQSLLRGGGGGLEHMAMTSATTTTTTTTTTAVVADKAVGSDAGVQCDMREEQRQVPEHLAVEPAEKIDNEPALLQEDDSSDEDGQFETVFVVNASDEDSGEGEEGVSPNFDLFSWINV